MERCNDVLQRQDANEAIQREFIEEASRQLEDIQQYLLLERTDNLDTAKGQRVKGRIQRRVDNKELKEMLADQQKLLDAHYKNKIRLQLQIAQQGGEHGAEVRLITALERTEKNIADTQNAIDRIKEELESWLNCLITSLPSPVG